MASIALTTRGEGQAGQLAREWVEVPSLIVTSPFQRTRQTAAPTIVRFPGVPVETWDIAEFTYPQPERWNGMAATACQPMSNAIGGGRPHYCDGRGAESFAGFLRRVEATLAPGRAPARRVCGLQMVTAKNSRKHSRVALSADVTSRQSQRGEGRGGRST